MSTDVSLEPPAADALSLDKFFLKQEEINLTNCDLEPVHIPGSIQNHGVMFILEPDTQRIVSMSENVGELFGVEEDEMQEIVYLKDLFPELAEAFEDMEVNRTTPEYEQLDYVNDIEGNTYNAVHHHFRGYDFLELWKEKLLSAHKLRNIMQTYHRVNNKILVAPTFEEASELLLKATRKLTGFSRILAVKFFPDWSGHMYAEDKAPHMRSLLDQRFTDAEIPLQARHILNMVPYRITMAADDEISLLTPALNPEGKPFDMTWSLLRSTSKFHTEYLRNMGVEATLIVPLMYNKKVWGLIACHNDKKGPLSLDTMGFVADLGKTLMHRYDQDVKSGYLEKVNAMKDVERDVATQMVNNVDFKVALEKYMPQLQDLMAADGCAFVYGDECVVSGEVPPVEFIHEMTAWGKKKDFEEGYLATPSLHEVWPKAREHMDTACGVLLDHVNRSAGFHMAWFRAPIVQSIAWMGNPDEKYGPQDPDNPDLYTPRTSFEKWVAKYKDKSTVWSTDEVQASRELSQNLMKIVSAHANGKRGIRHQAPLYMMLDLCLSGVFTHFYAFLLSNYTLNT